MSADPSETAVALAKSLEQFPSVTRILADAGLGPNYNGVPPATLERKRLLGQALHRAIQYDIEGTLDEASLHPDLAGAFRAYHAVRAAGFSPEQAEVELIEPTWRVVGHIDALGLTPAHAPMLIDWKMRESLDLDATAYQLAAYRWLARRCLARPGGQDWIPYAVELHVDGAFRLHNLDKRIAELDAERIFLAALTVHHARQRRRS